MVPFNMVCKIHCGNVKHILPIIENHMVYRILDRKIAAASLVRFNKGVSKSLDNVII